jgi:hypothetical protein
VLADMQLQRGPGFDDAAWQSATRSLMSILATQDVRLASAAASVRDRAFDDARASLDQSLGELQGALDLAQRVRASANARAQAALSADAGTPASATQPSPESMETQPIVLPASQPMQVGQALPAAVQSGAVAAAGAEGGPATTGPSVKAADAPRMLTLIEVRSGIVFRCDGTPTMIGRGLDAPLSQGQQYVNLSQACDPGEAEELGISRRHAEIARQGDGFSVRDLNSTNGTRVLWAGQQQWTPLQSQQWYKLHEGDALQFGLLVCSISLSR